jgi:hypothetical protein
VSYFLIKKLNGPNNQSFFCDRKPVDEDTIDMAYGGFEIMYENLIASNECKKITEP